LKIHNRKESDEYSTSPVLFSIVFIHPQATVWINILLAVRILMISTPKLAFPSIDGNARLIYAIRNTFTGCGLLLLLLHGVLYAK
jgi:hypothetical protein